ncbi:MAG TPA: hypothetical protein VNJ01_04555 [Bacteriovoracaceae bacterium]|nr:hypothetical protein [Bacteriovoracaceae bacterium]
MKGTFFNKPLEWNIEVQGESWQQGSILTGSVKITNHGSESIDLSSAGVALAYAEIKKVHVRAEGAMVLEQSAKLSVTELKPQGVTEFEFTFPLSSNSPVTDKKASYYLTYGKDFSESHLQVKIEPKALYTKIVGLLDTFCRFKLKDYKASKKGVEYKLLPPTSREMANIDSLNLTFSMVDETLKMGFDFQVKKLDTSLSITKVNKVSVTIEKLLLPKEYSLGKGMINQDILLKVAEAVIAEVKLKSVF